MESVDYLLRAALYIYHSAPVGQNTQFLNIGLYRCTELSDPVTSKATAAVQVYSDLQADPSHFSLTLHC